MFTISQIKEAHSKVKSGADFPSYIQELILLGVEKYETFVSDGRAEFYGADNYTTKSEPKYPELTIANESNSEQFKHYLKNHQQGQTNFLTFCGHSAECGIEKWVVNTSEMTCIYYDLKGNEILKELIPR